MKLSRLTIAFYILLVFTSGVVLGVFGHSLYQVSSVNSGIDKANPQPPKPEDFRKKVMAEMKSRLKLNDDQYQKINTVYDETRVQVHEVRERYKPDMDRIGREQTEKIKAVLTPDQQAEYDKMRKEREDQQKRNGNARPGGPGI